MQPDVDKYFCRRSSNHSSPHILKKYYAASLKFGLDKSRTLLEKCRPCWHLFVWVDKVWLGGKSCVEEKKGKFERMWRGDRSQVIIRLHRQGNLLSA